MGMTEAVALVIALHSTLCCSPDNEHVALAISTYKRSGRRSVWTDSTITWHARVTFAAPTALREAAPVDPRPYRPGYSAL
jgi:hypothetical protein